MRANAAGSATRDHGEGVPMNAAKRSESLVSGSLGGGRGECVVGDKRSEESGAARAQFGRRQRGPQQERERR